MDALSSDASSDVADLVSSFVQALYAVGQAEPTTVNQSGEDVRQLVLEFDGLPGVERDRVAGAITRLWDAFYARFDGLSGFLSAGYPERYAYLEQLETARERMACSRQGAASHYHTATAIGGDTAADVRSAAFRSSAAGKALSARTPPDGAGCETADR